MYEANSATKIIIGLTGTINPDMINNLLNIHILQSIKQCPNFDIKTIVIPNDEIQFNRYNFIFYLTSFDKIGDTNICSSIKFLSEVMTDPHNHLFIVVDGCVNLEMNDDGELVFADDDNNKIFGTFDDALTKLISDNLFHCYKISIEMSNIWNKILDDNSIVNLTDDQINILAPTLIKKSAKMTLVEKKREIKIALKKLDVDDKLAETGYTEFFNSVIPYFKLLHQKKIVCQNYLYAFNKINVSLNITDIDNINNLLKEIYGITYFKTEMHDDLIDKIDIILLAKLNKFYGGCKNNVVIESNQTGKIDAYAYYNFLVSFMNIAKGYNLSNIMEITNQEIEIVNNLITDYHKKEMEHVTDLEKISSYLEIFASKDKNNLNALFDKIRTHPKIMQENIDKMDKWIVFVNKCLKLGIPKDSIVRLMEEIIMFKISYYTDTSRINNKDITVIYPQCLQAFLLSNFNKNFMFKKLYMFLSYAIRYAGRNIVDYLKNIRMEQFDNLLIIEQRLLEICTIPIDEQSQPINLSEVDIVETFNENNKTPISPKQIKNIIIPVPDKKLVQKIIPTKRIKEI